MIHRGEERDTSQNMIMSYKFWHGFRCLAVKNKPKNMDLLGWVWGGADSTVKDIFRLSSVGISQTVQFKLLVLWALHRS